MILQMEEKFEDYLRDESKLQGYADSISFPSSEDDIRQIIEGNRESCITIQGGRTGLVGGAVPMGGHLMNLSRMNRILSYDSSCQDNAILVAEPGVSLMELEQAIRCNSRKRPMFWPCMPTEKSATVGGCVAANARGIYGNVYGPAGEYVEEVRLMLSSGEIVEASRDKDSRLLEEIVGSEGILGVITRVTLRLVPRPACIWGLALFFREEGMGAAFADAIPADTGKEAFVAAAEWIDRRGIELLEERKMSMSRLRDFPEIDRQYSCAVLLELHAQDEEHMLELAGRLMELSAGYGADPDCTWAMAGEQEACRLREYRHGVAEAVNMKVEENHRRCSRIVKLSSDMTMVGGFSGILGQYRGLLDQSGMDGTIFGHIMSRDLHMNLLPVNEEEYETARKILEGLAGQALCGGGRPVSEHGAGKIKAGMYGVMETWKRMARKQSFDPGGMWNRGDVANDGLCGMYQTGTSHIGRGYG